MGLQKSSEPLSTGTSDLMRRQAIQQRVEAPKADRQSCSQVSSGSQEPEIRHEPEGHPPQGARLDGAGTLHKGKPYSIASRCDPTRKWNGADEARLREAKPVMSFDWCSYTNRKQSNSI